MVQWTLELTHNSVSLLDPDGTSIFACVINESINSQIYYLVNNFQDGDQISVVRTSA